MFAQPPPGQTRRAVRSELALLAAGAGLVFDQAERAECHESSAHRGQRRRTAVGLVAASQRDQVGVRAAQALELPQEERHRRQKSAHLGVDAPPHDEARTRRFDRHGEAIFLETWSEHDQRPSRILEAREPRRILGDGPRARSRAERERDVGSELHGEALRERRTRGRVRREPDDDGASGASADRGSHLAAELRQGSPLAP